MKSDRHMCKLFELSKKSTINSQHACCILKGRKGS